MGWGCRSESSDGRIESSRLILMHAIGKFPLPLENVYRGEMQETNIDLQGIY